MQPALVPPTLLGKEQLEAGNPLAQWVAMVELEERYRASKEFAAFYAEARANAEEFLGFPMAGVAAMSLPTLRMGTSSGGATSIPAGFEPQRALAVVVDASQSTRAVIWAEEHHDGSSRRPLGFEACDAYVFWPRFAVEDGRPDWMTRTLGRDRVPIPDRFAAGHGPRLIEAFVLGEPATAIAADQVVLTDENDAKALMLPAGDDSLRTLDAGGEVLESGEIHVPE